MLLAKKEKTGVVRVLIKDADTGKVLSEIPNSSTEQPLDLAVLEDIGGGPADEVVILTDALKSWIRDAESTETVTKVHQP